MQLKKLTLLHSNDMHGDFLAEDESGKLIGGVSMLSGYIQKVRAEEKNVVYTVSGDMLRGSVIDSEYKGLSTMEIMNMLAPDVATLGNHEIDYGIGHLLFLEKCARFPLINANLYLNTTHVRLFKSHLILEVDGIKILFIGVLTEDVLAQARQEKLVGSYVDVHDAAEEVGKICNAYRSEDVDLTVLLTHIGLEEDKKLAEKLDPRWGVDIIIGGHSHSYMETPCVVAGIPIVQAVTGTDQIGRFDIAINKKTNTMQSYTWELIPIDESHCPKDLALEKVLHTYDKETKEKYERYITRFLKPYTHPARNRETQLGKIFSDAVCDRLGLDIMFLASGSIREPEMGPIVTYRELSQMFPFHDEIYRVTVTGKQLKSMVRYLFRPEALADDHGEFYQFSKGVKIVVDAKKGTVKEFTFCGKPIEDNEIFRIGLQGYHYKNMKDIFGITEEEIAVHAPSKVVATNILDVLDEHLCTKELITCPSEERWRME